MTKLKWQFTSTVLASALVAGCGDKTPEQRLDDFQKTLGKYEEITNSDFIVRWPGWQGYEGEIPPVTLKIPREYFEKTLGNRDEKGEFQWLYVVFGIPGPKPLSYMPLPLRTASQKELDAYDAYRRARVMAVIDRDAFITYRSREAIRVEAKQRGYLQDGRIGGLDRYSRVVCRTRDPKSSDLMKFIDEKPSDDPSPSDCRADRLETLLASPLEVTGDHEGVTGRCMSTVCRVYFRAGQRGASISVNPMDIARWHEKVEPARQLIDSFVVSGKADTPANPGNK